MPVAYYGFGSEDGKKRFLNNALEITTEGCFVVVR